MNNMEDMLKAQEVYAEDPIQAKILETLILAALFDVSKEVRDVAVGCIKQRYEGIIRRGFVADNQIFVRAQHDNFSPQIIYVCDMPQEYQGRKPEPASFSI